jgi:hypothetical protein
MQHQHRASAVARVTTKPQESLGSRIKPQESLGCNTEPLSVNLVWALVRALTHQSHLGPKLTTLTSSRIFSRLCEP